MKSFEERLARLESLSTKLRDGKTPLEEAMALFEEGMKLARGLEKEISRIERKVEILVSNPTATPDTEEEPVLELFPELSDDEGGG